MKTLREKPFVVIDLGSGSYLQDNEGHEKYNEIRNPITGKYYGYAPPGGKLNIQELGASKSDTYVSDVLVIYVKKAEETNDRVISSFIESATVYAKPIEDKSLKRYVHAKGKMEICTYCIESEDITLIEEIPGVDAFKLGVRGIWRPQRFYKGKRPDLDERILSYLESLSLDDTEIDDAKFQEDIQGAPELSSKMIENSSKEAPQFSESTQGQQVKKRAVISKIALQKAGYKCECDSSHKTFENKIGNPYMEGHHLIPCTTRNAKRIWTKHCRNIDCLENIVCVCPNCHRQIHYGSPEARKKVLESLYNKRVKSLASLGINISYEELEALYK